jgi:TonB family protein
MSITERLRYGATELKAAYSSRIVLAFVVSMALHAAAIGLYLATTSAASALRDEVVVGPDLPPIEIGTYDIEKDEPNGGPKGPIADPLEPSVDRRTAGQKVAGMNPIVTDEPGAKDSSEFPPLSMAPLSGSGTLPSGPIGGGGPIGGDPNGGGGGGGGDETNGTGKGATDEPLDATEFFLPDVELPEVDMGAIARRVEYPKIAQTNQLEGTVNVKVLIGLDGAPEKVEVLTTTNRIFDAAALDAVRASQFTPARQDGVPVRIWMNIPIRFQLD